MPAPVLKHGSHLIVTVPPTLTDAGLAELRGKIVRQVGECRARGVILDVTAVDVMDSFACRMYRDIAQMIRLQGATTVLVGLQPEVAFAMVQLGTSLTGVATALDLEEGLAHVNAITRKPQAGQS